MNGLKKLLKRLLGKGGVSSYHKLLAKLASFIYGQPSSKLIVIGVTGTNGKSTTVNLIAKILESAGNKVAISSTVNFKVAGKEWLNDMKMTMPGRFFLQNLLKQAVTAGCRYVIVEVTSEGIVQHRHAGIHFDVVVFTNLTPEHLESHGGFENYKAAKLSLFRRLENLPHKIIAGKLVKKIIVVNQDDANAQDFMKFKVDQIVKFGQQENADIRGQNLSLNPEGLSFQVKDVLFNLKLLGQFDFYNSLAASATAISQGISLKTCADSLGRVANVPGRMEVIQQKPFTVIVDYAYEPEEMRQVYETISRWQVKRVIQVLGPSGGGRDRARISILGKMAGKFAAVVFITTDDPYDDDPKLIGEQMFDGAVKSGKQAGLDLFMELDRRKAINLALNQAKSGDLVLITGKGSDQKMAVKGGYVPWDDRTVVKEELAVKI
ncbi:MAG TPA: UDP-N-acetylmuramyl-tripeptide synthetase [Patescibacteria group bacterium]|jgi:UDP-N-acetylmuramoyl-L-alanyl-D-glutamate--2,6-diaminopimelate ligase|nr:UDP-N-acetylmuramyl-tripeptide synthetase [Patescibacteria group bacterium]